MKARDAISEVKFFEPHDVYMVKDALIWLRALLSDMLPNAAYSLLRSWLYSRMVHHRTWILDLVEQDAVRCHRLVLVRGKWHPVENTN